MKKDTMDLCCNCCGNRIHTGRDRQGEDYLDLTKAWGYFSRNKDGQVHHITLCESCYDNWTGEFVLPVEIREETELL